MVINTLAVGYLNKGTCVHRPPHWLCLGNEAQKAADLLEGLRPPRPAKPRSLASAASSQLCRVPALTSPKVRKAFCLSRLL